MAVSTLSPDREPASEPPVACPSVGVLRAGGSVKEIAVKRWLVLTLGLGLAAVVGYALTTLGQLGRGPSAQPAEEAARVRTLETPGAGAAQDRIGERSREALRDILREAESEESR